MPCSTPPFRTVSSAMTDGQFKSKITLILCTITLWVFPSLGHAPEIYNWMCLFTIMSSLGRVWASPFLVISAWTSSVCLSVCLSVWMDRNHFRLLFCARFASCVNSKNTRREPHGQSNSSVATTRTETTHGLAYPVARAIDISLALDPPALCRYRLSLLPESWCLCQSLDSNLFSQQRRWRWLGPT